MSEIPPQETEFPQMTCWILCCSDAELPEPSYSASEILEGLFPCRISSTLEENAARMRSSVVSFHTFSRHASDRKRSCLYSCRSSPALSSSIARIEKSRTFRSFNFPDHSDVRMKSGTLAKHQSSFFRLMVRHPALLKNPLSVFLVAGGPWKNVIFQKIISRARG